MLDIPIPRFPPEQLNDQQRGIGVNRPWHGEQRPVAT